MLPHSGSLICEYNFFALFNGGKEDSKGFMVLRVRPTQNLFPINIFNAVMDSIVLNSIIPLGHSDDIQPCFTDKTGRSANCFASFNIFQKL